MLNPGDYYLPKPPSYSNDKFTYFGYFIAGDRSDTESIGIFKDKNNFLEETDKQLQRHKEMKLI